VTTFVATWQRCLACGHRLGEFDAAVACPRCGGLLDLERDPTALSPDRLRPRFAERAAGILVNGGPAGSGVWRYRELILDVRDDEIVSYPEGNTPLVERDTLTQWVGCRQLLLKHEGMNPTGSFKDRGMTVGVTQARRIGATAVVCASTGNTSASLAAYAALGGLPAVVLVPAGKIALGKMAQTLAYGARTLLVRGDFDDCLTLARQASAELGVYLLNSVNPFRVEGQKSIVLEMLHQLDWEPPDWIALPAGNLGNTAAFGKALREARDCGLIDRMPRLLAVQAAGAAPFHHSYVTNFTQRTRVTAETVATAIRIGNPASFDRAVLSIRATNGVVLAVPDAEILEAKARIDASGVGCEPASAAGLAGVRAGVESGLITREQRVACVLTGNMLKDPDLIVWYHQRATPAPPQRNAPLEVDPTLAAVEAVLGDLVRR
jgi:threonine synthase